MGMYSRKGQYPSIRFRAGDVKSGNMRDNVNFARQDAEKLAAETGQTVTLYRVVNGRDQVLQEVQPPVKATVHPLFHEIWSPEA